MMMSQGVLERSTLLNFFMAHVCCGVPMWKGTCDAEIGVGTGVGMDARVKGGNGGGAGHMGGEV